MNRLLTASLLVWHTATVFSATDIIQADPGENLIAVEVQVGENRLIDLFPEAPVGTIIYKFDTRAWSAAQKYPFGWSHPNQKIHPYEGAVMILPTNSSVNFTLTGEPVALPPADYATLNSSTNQVNVYRGYNLISAKLARHLAETRGEAANIYIYNKSLKRFAVLVFDDLSNEWFPTAPAIDGAVWYQSSEAPPHPRGSFVNTNTPVYFNNFAPAYGIDRPFVESNCVARTTGTAELVALNTHRRYGEAVFSTNFPGYFDPSNLVRYVRSTDVLVTSVQPGGSIFGGYFSVPEASLNPPAWPVPAQFPPLELFYGPESITFRPGTNGQIYVVYSSILQAARKEQWQKKALDGQWVDLAGATNQTLTFPNMKASDAGEYRMRFTLNCEVVYSDVATVTYLAPKLSLTPQPNGTKTLMVTLPIVEKAKVQTSTNLQTWTDIAEFALPRTIWTTNLTASDEARFYRAVEVPY